MDGSLGGRQGSFALQQFGSLHGGSQTLHYEVVPGSGSGQLDGLTGILHLNIDEDGATATNSSTSCSSVMPLRKTILKRNGKVRPGLHALRRPTGVQPARADQVTSASRSTSTTRMLR